MATHIITFDKDITTINSGAFANQTKLTSISFPDGITLENNAFQGCINLESVNIPQNVTIQGRPFNGCTKLVNAPENIDYSEPFYVENITNNVETLQIIDYRDDQPLYMEIPFEYSIDGTAWNTLGTTGETPLTRTLQSGDKVYLRATANSLHRNYVDGIKVRGTSKVGGNIMSLLYGSAFTGNETTFPSNLYNYQFCKLFESNQNLIDASELNLPVTTLTEGCYMEMFSGCTALTIAPQILPATTLAEICYKYMFSGCNALTTAPRILSATTLAVSCCIGMFYGCESLITAPALPATTLAEYCYNDMFCGCTALTIAPALPATTLAEGCYKNMFSGCTSLTTAPALPATTLAECCYQNMFLECASLTTPPALPATVLADECYSSMFYWCTSLTTVPALPATTLADDCYNSMFRECTSLTLSDIPILPATTLAVGCYSDMFAPISIDQNDFESWCSQHIVANNYDPNDHGYPVVVQGDVVR